MTSIPNGNIDRERLLREQRRRKRANPWRCLLPLRYGGYAIAVVLALEAMESALCSMSPPIEGEQCLAIVPEWLPFAMMAVVVGAAVACVHRWWRHHSKDEHYRSRVGER